MLSIRVLLFVVFACAPLRAAAQDEVPAAEADVPDAPAAPETEATVVAERDTSAAPAALLLEENAGRARTNRIGAFVLGGWALGNFTWATVGLVTEPDDRQRGFHLTNAAVNLAIAGVAVGTYFSNVPDDTWEEFGVVDTLNEAHGTEKLYLLATGLDVAYFMTGAFLTAKGNVDQNEGMIGSGRSLMFQASFLFAFDAAMFTFHMLRRTKFLRQLTGGETP